MSDSLYAAAQRPYHATARCSECEWFDEWYLTASAAGKEHCVATGHTVDFELGFQRVRKSGTEVLEELGVVDAAR